MKKIAQITLNFLFTAASLATFAQEAPFDSTSKPLLISKQFSFTEGASVDKKGNVFFTDQPNNKIWQTSTNRLKSFARNNAINYYEKISIDLLKCFRHC